jgi:hypothetical protein
VILGINRIGAEEPKVNVDGIEELVADKGHHSRAVLEQVKKLEVRTYIPERKQVGKRNWDGKQSEQQAVKANRSRVTGDYSKQLLRKRSELVERSYVHCYETGGMRRCALRGHKNILKRLLIHIGAFNISLILRDVGRGYAARTEKPRGKASFTPFQVARVPLSTKWRSRILYHSGSCPFRRLSPQKNHNLGLVGIQLLLPRAANLVYR